MYISSDYSKNNTFKIAYERFSPYLEVTHKSTINEVYVNTLLRFGNIFNEQEFFKYNKGIDNTILHFLAQLDFYKSIYSKDIKINIVKEKIQNGVYGKNLKYRFNNISMDIQEIIIDYIILDDKNNQKKFIFKDILKDIFTYSSIFYLKDEEKFVIFLDYDKNEENENIFLVIKELFLDIFYNTYVTWKNPVAIIGIYEEIDKCIIY
ncbi:MAG: hypothetical protein R3Y64_08940 [Peptostreptococcaceae bacterium]